MLTFLRAQCSSVLFFPEYGKYEVNCPKVEKKVSQFTLLRHPFSGNGRRPSVRRKCSDLSKNDTITAEYCQPSRRGVKIGKKCNRLKINTKKRFVGWAESLAWF